MVHNKHLPVPGQRIFRSMVAVWLCFALYFLRGRHGIPFYSVIAALQCLQPYNKEMRNVARKRITGTVVGAAWGLICLLLELELIHEGVPDEIPHYLLMGFAVGVVLYSTVLLNISDSAYFSAVVFLTVAVNHIGDANPYLFAFNRLLDTVLGVLIAEVINRVHLPRAKKRDTLFVSDLEDVLFPKGGSLSSYSRIELNRLIEDGARFTIATEETQATVRQLLPGVNLPYPIIIMNGAALYDLSTMEYLHTIPMPFPNAERLIRWVEEQKLSCFINSVEDNLLVVRFGELSNEAMKEIFQVKRTSPYRNFVHSPVHNYESVLYLFVLDTQERIEAAFRDFSSWEWSGEYHIVKGTSKTPGFSYLKIYDTSVSRQAMLKILEEKLGMEKTVLIGKTPREADLVVSDPGNNQAVKLLKRHFEPVDLCGWRNCFRL